jgi:hypothetical protein
LAAAPSTEEFIEWVHHDDGRFAGPLERRELRAKN